MKNNETTTFAELAALKPADLFAQGATIPKYNKAIARAQDTFKNSLHVSAKIVAALKRLYTAQQNAKGVSPDLPFSSKKANKIGFFEQNCKGELPPRVEAIAALFNQLVLTMDGNGKPFLAEEFFDNAKIDWLEKANAIISAAIKEHSETDLSALLAKSEAGANDVLDTINALSGKPFQIGDTAGTLKEIRKRQKGTLAASGAEPETQPLSLMVAVTFIKAQFTAAADASRERQIELALALFEMEDAWANNDMTENRRHELDQQIQHARENGISPQIEIKREMVAP